MDAVAGLQRKLLGIRCSITVSKFSCLFLDLSLYLWDLHYSQKKKGVEYGPAAIREAGLLKRLSLLGKWLDFQRSGMETRPV